MGFLNPDPLVPHPPRQWLNPLNPSSPPLSLGFRCCTESRLAHFSSSAAASSFAHPFLPPYRPNSPLRTHLPWRGRLFHSPSTVQVNMFYLSQIEHSLPMPPHLLRPPLLDAIRGELEKLFLDKVIANLGLCISIYDILSVDGGFIFPGDGCATYKVQCRLVMFKPFIGEVIVGKIESCDEFGLQVSLGFFSDIKIPSRLMMQPCHRREDGIWIWDYGDGGEDSQFSLDINEEIRFRVANVKFPPIPVEQSEDSKPFSPMEIAGDINGDGLGLVSWW